MPARTVTVSTEARTAVAAGASTDGGATWHPANSGPPRRRVKDRAHPGKWITFTIGVTALAIDPKHSETLYAATGRALKPSATRPRSPGIPRTSGRIPAEFRVVDQLDDADRGLVVGGRDAPVRERTAT